MKITMYELLGMVKDGKAPKKIKWGCHNFEWFVGEYVALDEYGKPSLCEVVGNIEWVLNDEVEILEEEKKIPEKINICTDATNMEYIKGKSYGKNYSKSSLEIAHTINEIIDYLNYLKNKGE